MKKTNTIARILGGSHLYGLSTPESDRDERFIFITLDPGYIIGLSRYDHQIFQEDDPTKPKKDCKDEQGYELRHFLRMLSHSNTQCMEFLFAPETAFVEIQPDFQLVRSFAFRLVNTEGLYKSMSGYVMNELRLATGERTGKLGGKRKAQLDKYGFSPNNFVHILRLTHVAAYWFKQGKYYVNMKELPGLVATLMNIKLHPELYTKEKLTEMALISISMMDEAYPKRVIDTKFDADLANDLCLEIYYPHLSRARQDGHRDFLMTSNETINKL